MWEGKVRWRELVIECVVESYCSVDCDDVYGGMIWSIVMDVWICRGC